MNTNIYNKVCALVCATLLSANAIAQTDAPTMLITLKSGKTLEYKEFGENSQIGFLPHDTVYTRPATGEILPELMAKDATISLFYEAMQATGMIDSIADFLYPNYSCSDDSTENGTCYKTAVEYDNVFYPEYRLKKYTVFTPQNTVFAAKGINSLADLKTYAAQVYDAMYPEDAQVFDPKDRRNSLNRFVSYHMLDRMGYYYGLTAMDGGKLGPANFDRRNFDIADWYETMMPHSVLKCSYPSGSESGIYINRRGVQDHEDYYGMQIRGAKLTAPSELTINNEAVNGIYHYIDDLLLYDKTTQFSVLNERWRLDASTLSPDFMSNGARGHKVRGNGGNSQYPGYYGAYSNSSDPDINPNTCLGFKAGSVKNFEYNDAQTHLHVRPRYLNFWSYQGDEVMIAGQFDFTVKLPPMPEGEWELRLATCLGFDNRGVIQYSIDGQPCGEPVDMRIGGDDPHLGWISDDDFGEMSTRLAQAIAGVIYYDEVFNEMYNAHYKELFDSYDQSRYDSEYIDQMFRQRLRYLTEDYIRENYADKVAEEYQEKYYGEYYRKLNALIEKYTAAGDESPEYRAKEELAEEYEAIRVKMITDWDRGMRQRGWMKGPASYGSTAQDGSGMRFPMRKGSTMARRIIGTIKSDGKSDHYLHVQQTLQTHNATLAFDYIELCPKSVYDNPDLPEDIY